MSVPDENGKYDQAEVDALIAERNKGLEGNRDEIKRELAAARAKLKNFDGIDPEEHTRLREAVAEAERKKAEGEGDWKTLERQMAERQAAREKQLIEKHTSEIEATRTKEDKLTRSVHSHLVQSALTKAIAASKGVPDLLLPYAEKFVKVRETEDGYEAYVCDEKGNQRFADGKGTAMDIDAFVQQELMSKFPRAFDGVGSSGGGASKSAGSAGGSSRVSVTATNSPDFLANLKDIASGKVEIDG